MKKRLIGLGCGFWFLASGFCFAQSGDEVSHGPVSPALPASRATNVFGITPNTNALGFIWGGVLQGVANNGTNIFIFATTGISKYQDYTFSQNHNGVNFVTVQNMTNGLPNFSSQQPPHSGDGDYFGGFIFGGIEATVGGNFPLGTTNLGIAMYDGVNGGNLYDYFSVSNVQIEISSVTVGIVSNNPTVFASAFLPLGTAAANNTIFEYSTSSLTNLTFVKALTLNTNLVDIQGLKFVNGVLYALCDQATGFGSSVGSGRLFAIDVTNQTASLYCELNLSGQAEWEGLDNFNGTTNTTTTGLAIACEGNNGAAIYNLFNLPSVASNQVFVGKFIRNIRVLSNK